MNNRITNLFGIDVPIIQAGMVWCSGWRLASAVSNAGGLGMLGAGSMRPEMLREQIAKTRAATQRPFAVNVPLLYPAVEEHLQSIIDLKVPIVFTSAGNPATHTARLKDAGITVVHVVSSSKFAEKATQAGVDALVAEGTEAGGHNGREETTTFVLIPGVRQATHLPLLAAGGIATGQGVLAAMALGADGVQVGSRFIATNESSAHENYKNHLLQTREGDTRLMLKSITPTRMLLNPFGQQIAQMEADHANADVLKEFVGKGRPRKGMLEGDLEEGELEVGQASALIRDVKSAAEVVLELWSDALTQHALLAKQFQPNKNRIDF